MTQAQGTPQPGWYADPAGTPQQRWWDGAQWSDRLYDSSAVASASQPPQVAAGTPANTPFIWAVVLLPLLSLLTFAFWDIESYMRRTAEGDPFALFEPGYVLITATSWLLFGATVVLSFLDYRQLQRRGFVRPFHWAWSFLSSLVYVIGRAVVIGNRGGSAWGPIWVLAAVTVVSVTVALIKVGSAMSTMLQSIPGI